MFTKRNCKWLDRHFPISLLIDTFPASRGLSRWDKLKREERDLCRLPTSFLSRMPSRFQWCFCHVWHNPENWFEFERRASGFQIWARAQILNGPIRVEDETTLRAAVVVDSITNLWGKPKRRVLRQIFHSSRVFRPPKHTYLELNLFWTSLERKYWNCSQGWTSDLKFVLDTDSC